MNLQRRILRPKAQCAMLGIAHCTLYRFAKSPDFPKSVRIGLRSVGRFEDELIAWLEARKGSYV